MIKCCWKPGGDNFNKYLFLTFLSFEYDHHHHDDIVSFAILEISVSSINISVYFLKVSFWLFSGFKTHMLEIKTCFGA